MDDQGDLTATYAARRAQLDLAYKSLPKAGSQAYWDALSAPGADGLGLPLEVLVSCCRRWISDYRLQEAGRVFDIIMRRIERRLDAWANKIARQAPGGRASGVAEVLKQECLLKLWEELGSGGAFWVENFGASFDFLEKKVASIVMEREGYWSRKGVKTPNRIPAQLIDSLNQPVSRVVAESAPEAGDDQRTLGQSVAAPNTEVAFELAEALADLPDLMRQLTPELRAVYLARIKNVFEERTQQQTADELGVTTRTVRTRLRELEDTLRALLVDPNDTPAGESQGERKDTIND